MAEVEGLLGEGSGNLLRSGDFADTRAASVAGEGAKSNPTMGARAQFHTTAGLDLTSSDPAVLATGLGSSRHV